MKSMFYQSCFCVAALLLLYGCMTRIEPYEAKAEVEVELSGAFGLRTRASIDPQPDSLPPYQLSIGVALLNYDSANPETDQPDGDDWNGAVNWKRAYFGGPGLHAPTVTNGEIKFTNDAGTAINKVFYDENGLWCFLRAVYPYEGATVTSSHGKGSILFPIDGSQDIMCANLVWGSVNKQMVDRLIFKHLLTKLNIRLYAENQDASDQYGEIEAVGVAYQPAGAILDIATGNLQPEPTSSTTRYDRYYTVDFDPSANRLLSDNITDPTDPDVNFGYVMAIPAAKYSIWVKTENRLEFYTEVTLPSSSFEAGKAYNITLKFLATDQIIIFAEEATEWWLDSTFN